MSSINKSLISGAKYISQFINDLNEIGIGFNNNKLYTDNSNKLFWNDGSLATTEDISNKLEKEFAYFDVKNNTSSIIPKATACTIYWNTDHISAEPSTATNNLSFVDAFALEDIPINGSGMLVTRKIFDYDTSMWPSFTTLYLSKTGGFTIDITDYDIVIPLGFVLKSSVNGTIILDKNSAKDDFPDTHFDRNNNVRKFNHSIDINSKKINNVGNAVENSDVPNYGQVTTLLQAETDARISSESNRYTKLEMDAMMYVEHWHSETVNLVSGVSIDFNLTTNIIEGIVPKVYVNGKIAAFENTNMTYAGYKITYTPTETISNAEVVIFYSSLAKELPKDISTVSVKFLIDSPNTTITNAAQVKCSKDAAMVKFNWGDGTIEDLPVEPSLIISPSHTYVNPGEYNVVITEDYGLMTSCVFNTQSVKVVSDVTKVKSNSIVTLASMFLNQLNLKNTSSLIFETPNVTSINGIFQSSGLEYTNSNIFKNLTKVTASASVFRSSKLKEVPANIFDVLTLSSGFSYGFYQTAITSLPDGLFYNNLLAIDFSNCFSATADLIKPSEKLFYYNTKVTTFSGVFNQSGIQEIFADTFNAEAPATYANAVRDCKSLLAIPDNMFNGFNLALSFDYCFFGGIKIATAGINLWKNCSSSTSFRSALSGCSLLTSIGDGWLEGCTAATNCATIISGNAKLVTIPRYAFRDLVSATTFASICQTSPLLEGNINDLFSAPGGYPNADIMTSALRSLPKLTGSGVAFIAKFTKPPTATGGTLLACTGLSDLASVPSTWK